MEFDVGAASQEAILKRAKPVLIGAGVLLVLIWLLRWSQDQLRAGSNPLAVLPRR